MCLFGASVGADARTTQIALDRGGVEVGIPYRWENPAYVPATRIAIGVGEGVLLNKLHKTRPKTAWAILIAATLLNGAVAQHNSKVGE